jgi:hypothetical protein
LADPEDWSGSLCGEVLRSPIPGQEVGDPLGWMIRQAREYVSEPGLWIDVVELGGLDERVDGGRAMPAFVGAREGPVLAADRNLAVILPISGKMSSSIIAGIHCTDGACVVFRASGAHQVMSCTWSCRPAP